MNNNSVLSIHENVYSFVEKTSNPKFFDDDECRLFFFVVTFFALPICCKSGGNSKHLGKVVGPI